MKTVSSPPGKPYLHPFFHDLLSTTKGDVGASRTHKKETGKSDIEDWRTLSAGLDFDIEAQGGAMPVKGKSFYRLPRPPFRRSLSHTV